MMIRMLRSSEILHDLPERQNIPARWGNKLSTAEPYFASIAAAQQYKLGLSLDEIIVDCKFHGVPCSETGEFILYKHYMLHNCYTFRHNMTIEGKNFKIRSGPEHGLSLILVGNSRDNPFYNMDSTVANVVGYKVVIHERGSIPAIEHKGVDIQAGQSTNIALVATKHTRLEKPYGNCFQQDTMNEDGSNSHIFTYSKELCEQEKLAKLISEICQCKSVKFYSRNVSSHRDNCFYVDEQLENLTLSLKRAFCEIQSLDTGFLAEDENSECVWPCNEWTYETSMSATQWLPSSMINSFLLVYVHRLSCDSPIWWYYEALLHHYNQSNPHGEYCKENLYLFNYTRSYTKEDTFLATAQMHQGQNVSWELFVNATLRPEIDKTLLDYIDVEDSLAQWIKTHFYRLNVYFRETAYEHHTQVERISLTDLLSGIGGTLGLWCGISVITAVEICVFIGRSFKMHCLSCRKKHTDPNGDEKVQSNGNSIDVKADKL